jgi:6-phosphogluconolactonase (cycloisomerase 2 family)
MSDPLASQGSLVRDGDLLLAVNAGSDSITAFRIVGDTLVRTQVVSSGGPFPTSLAVHGDLVYVLDAGGQGFVSGYRVAGDTLEPIAGSTRTLLLGNTTPPFFLSSPAQIGFTPNGQHLIVTTKTHSTVDVFSIADGVPSAAPVKNPEAGVPFAFVFNSAEQMVLVLAGTGSLEAFTVNADDTITPAGAPVSDGQVAACWVTPAHGFDYVSNTGSNDVSQFQSTSNGTVALVNPVAASNIPGAIDSDSAGGAYLYVQAGLSGSVHVFRIGPDGSLTLVQVAAVPDGDDQEGIVVA